MHVEDFESTILVSSREDELAIVYKLHLSRLYVGGLHIRDTIVRTQVLIDTCLEFCLWGSDVYPWIIHREVYLLVALICVNIGVATHLGRYSNTWFNNGERGLCYRILLIILAVDTHYIVARHE